MLMAGREQTHDVGILKALGFEDRSVFDNVDAVARLSTCSDSDERGLMNAVAGSNLYQDGSAVFAGGDGGEPHDSVFVPEYEYDVELEL